jgi:hypothetical protein
VLGEGQLKILVSVTVARASGTSWRATEIYCPLRPGNLVPSVLSPKRGERKSLFESQFSLDVIGRRLPAVPCREPGLVPFSSVPVTCRGHEHQFVLKKHFAIKSYCPQMPKIQGLVRWMQVNVGSDVQVRARPQLYSTGAALRFKGEEAKNPYDSAKISCAGQYVELYLLCSVRSTKQIFLENKRGSELLQADICSQALHFRNHGHCLRTAYGEESWPAWRSQFCLTVTGM